MIKKVVLFFFFVGFVVSGFSQRLKQFDEDFEKYPETVAEMFAVNVTDADKTFISEFAGNWSGGMFSGNEKARIVAISNAFLAKKARNIHYLMLWRCVQSFKKPENSGKGDEAWTKAVAVMCEDRRVTPTALQSLMTATQNLLDRRLVCSSPGNDWRYSGDDFRYDFSGNQLSVIFGTSDITCLSKGDSIMIGQTSGRFSVSTQRWKGRGGVVTWERAGFSPGDVVARLGDYIIDMRKSQYEADSVFLTHKTYFPTPVAGKLIDKVRHNPNPETAIYPEFIAIGKKFVFEDIYPGVSYKGGILIQGARTTGSGTGNEDAIVSISKNDSLRMDIRSKSFVFRNDRVNAQHAALTVHLLEDSIFHNNLSFVYLVGNREVSFTRSDAASSQAPYSDSYHKVDMDFEQLIWKPDDPVMSLSATRGSAGGRSGFRSQNYFDRHYFESMQYFDMMHPLVAIRNCAAEYGSVTFSSELYARFIRMPLSTARVQLIEIAKLGFILYDGDTNEATVQPRLYEFLDAAAKKTDFDVINLHSSVQAPEKNALLDTRNYDMTINGIEKFMVSDSQRVVITPNRQRVVMKKNRAMHIDGRIDAGQLELYGDSLFFDYDTFKINLHRVDSLYMFVPSGNRDAFGKPVQRRLKTAIEKLSGSILIDRPDNKSGRVSLPEYPILKSDSASYVYYASSDIEGGAYDNESFYFELDPFVVDSTDNFSKESLALTGKFVSADIFSDLRQTLRVQPDYSLGFIYDSSDSAINAYNDARLSAEVRLSNRGLEASGVLDYLTASIHTDEFKIYPDSMNVPSAKEFLLRKQTEGTEFPEVRSEKNRIHWEPGNDKMYIYKHEKNFDMYNPETQFDGSLLLTPGGLSGSGSLVSGSADIRSADIDFRSNAFNSDVSAFRLKSDPAGSYRMTTVDSVRSTIDFNNRRGRFVPAGDYALVRFPGNKFAAYVDEFSWDMDSAKIRIGRTDTLTRPLTRPGDFKYGYPGEGKGSRYYSTAPEADSLNFVASSAVFNYVTGNLEASGVNLLKVSDAVIYPGNGSLTLTPEGALDKIKNARIVFNDSIEQHVLHSAEVKITGRNRYSGFGKYDWTDETGKISVIDIPYIGTDRAGKTTARGSISGEDDFMISPFFRYRGNVNLLSELNFAEFDGVAQIIEECETLRPDRFKFKSAVDPKNVKLPVDEAPVNINNSKIYNGIFLTNDSTHIYPAFFSARRNYSDNPLISAHGVLTYDKDSMVYFIGSENKIGNRDTTGNILAFDRDKCLLAGEGKISLGIDLGRVKTEAAGRIVHNLNNRETTMDVIMSFDFLFDDGLAAMVASKIDSFPSGTGVDMGRSTYIRGMNEWLGVQKNAAFRREALMGKVRNFPDELKHTLVLTQLRLQWNRNNRSYRSTGKIGVGNLFGHQVNRLVDGVVEFTKRPGGDFMDIYLKLDDRNWFYFGYTRELMQVVSSDPTFNDRLVNLSEKQRKSEEKRPGYTYMIASSDKVGQLLRRIRLQEGAEEREELPQPPAGPVIRDQGRTEPAPLPGTPKNEEKEEEAPIIEVE